MKNRHTFKTSSSAPAVTEPASAPTTEAATLAETGCPFGDISGEKIRFTQPVVLPVIYEMPSDIVKEAGEKFNLKFILTFIAVMQDAH